MKGARIYCTEVKKKEKGLSTEGRWGMSHKRKGKVKRNNKMQLYSFNNPIIPARTKIPR